MRTSLKEQMARQDSAIEALSTPIIPLSDEILIMPLVGALEVDRVDRTRVALVHDLHARHAKVALLDLTGVPEIPGEVAPAIARTAQAARLVGASVIITGMQPSVASTLASLGLDLAEVQTEGSLADGIRRAMSMTEQTRRMGPA